jgi:hypothetical protein
LRGAGEGVEEGGFAHVGQADDASFEHKRFSMVAARLRVKPRLSAAGGFELFL